MAKQAEPEQTTQADPEPERIESLDARFGKIEAEQAEQKGMLQKIIDLLPGKSGETGETGDGTPEPRAGSDAGAADIQSTVRKEIAAADERRKAEEREAGEAAWRQGVTEVIEQVKAERVPREPQTGIRGRLQRALMGPGR